MPNNQQALDLRALKADPKLWMRLAMPSKNGKNLENVFKDKENPFEKNDIAAMETIKRLAAEGNLYLRDFGRSRHFHKVEKAEDELKLGSQHEMKFSNSTANPILAVLMWMSRGYFKWLGLDRISNWFDKRLKRRAEINELNDRYKEEYKSLTREQKKELKALRKHEKNLKKLENAQKKVEQTQQKLDEIQGVDTKTKGEMESPLSQPPQVEQKENTMQPTHLGDKPIQQTEPEQRTQENNPVQQTVQQESTGKKKEEPQQKEKSQLFIEGVELTEETAKQFPPHIVEAFKQIQQMIIDAKANEKANEKVNQPSIPVPPPLETRPPLNEKKQENPAVINETKAVEVPQAIENEQQGNRPMEPAQNTEHVVQEQIINNEHNQPTADKKVPEHEIKAPLKDGANLEPERINIQERPKDQAQTNLPERLAAEREAMNSVANWKDRLVSTLFSNEGVSTAREYYDTLKNQKAGPDFLTGTVCGILSTTAADPESRKQIMEDLLNGRPLDSKYNNQINEGVTAYNHAVEQMAGGNRGPMTKLINDAVLEFGRQASRETSLSPRLAMIGRMISNTMDIADRNALRLQLNDDQWKMIRGASQLSVLAQKHHNAKQFLGKENASMHGQQGRDAVRDLLMGNAVEHMIRVDKRCGEEITNTQLLMGGNYLKVDNLTKMMSTSTVRRSITMEQVKNILEKPDTFDSAKIAKQLGDELIDIADQSANVGKKHMQLNAQMQNEPEKEQQQLESMQLI